MKQFMRKALLVTALLASMPAQAEPETRLRFDSSMQGFESGGRFGAEVACSRPGTVTDHDSVVAVAAPQAAAGEGRVYLFDPVQPAAVLQVLSPTAEQTAARFGSAIQFIDDINADLIDDLIIGAPGALTNSEGAVYLFTSVISEIGLRYSSCGMAQGPQGFGQELQAVRASGGSSAANVVIANPRLVRIDGFAVSAQSNGSCQFIPTSDFSETLSAGSGWGSSLSQVGSGSTGALARILVAAPGIAELGMIYQRIGLQSDPQELVISQNTFPEHSGLVVSGQVGASTYVIGSPRSNLGRGSVAVYGLDAVNTQPQCVLNNPQEDYSAQFGSNLKHLGGSFIGMFSSAAEVVALRSAEGSTGGALGFVSINALGCAGLIPANNCLADPEQEQGVALAGGSECQASFNGKLQRFLVSGSPGWSGQRGRVDIAFEDGILDTTHSCLTLGGLTPTPTISVGEAGAPDRISGITTVTPTPTPTVKGETTFQPTATATISASATSDLGDVGGHQPIVVSPGSGGLPTPVVIVRPGEVEVELPQVRPQLSTQQQTAMIKKLQKNRRISKNRAKQLMDDSDNLVITYVIRYWEVSSPRGFAFIQSAHAEDGSGRARKVKQIRTRLNTVTLRNLRPGAVFGLSYSVEISTKRPKSRLGVTQASDVVTFSTMP
jgi:hypothetical protein